MPSKNFQGQITTSVKILPQANTAQQFTAEDNFDILNFLLCYEDAMENNEINRDKEKISFRMMASSAINGNNTLKDYQTFKGNLITAFGRGKHANSLASIFRCIKRLVNEVTSCQSFDEAQAHVGETLPQEQVDETFTHTISFAATADQWANNDTMKGILPFPKQQGILLC